MTKRELEKKLKKAGWKIKHGGKHDYAIHQNNSAKIMLPRHKTDIPIGTAKSILDIAKIK